MKKKAAKTEKHAKAFIQSYILSFACKHCTFPSFHICVRLGNKDKKNRNSNPISVIRIYLCTVSVGMITYIPCMETFTL